MLKIFFSVSIQTCWEGKKVVFVYFFGGLECVGHSFAFVAHFVFLRDVWIRTQRAAEASRRATKLAIWIRTKRAAVASRRATNLATQLPFLATHLPKNVSSPNANSNAAHAQYGTQSAVCRRGVSRRVSQPGHVALRPCPQYLARDGAHERLQVTCFMYRSVPLCTFQFPVYFMGPKWYSPNGSMPFHRTQKSLDFQGPTPAHLPS